MTDPDFSLAGTPLFEWLGERPHEALIKAAEAALHVPGEAFIVAVFSEPSLPARKFSERQRRALRLWFNREQPDTPGRMRLNLRTQLHPDTSQDVKVAVVIYEPKVRSRAMPIDDALLKDLAELVDGSPWQMADRLLETFTVEQWGEGERGVKNDLYAALEEHSDALRREYGIELSVSTMRQARMTAVAWPDDIRVSSAPFKAHKALRAHPDRVTVLTRIVNRHRGHATYRQVQEWKSQQKGLRPVVPWLGMMERRLRRVITAAKTTEAKSELAGVLDRLADELRRG